jgi:predicted TIM-barrel fold metal-dependent hydrolase
MAQRGVIDCDTHYWETPAIWSDYLDPAYRDRAPTFVQDGERLLVRVGESIYPSAPQHRGLGATYGPDETLHPQTIWDKDVSTDAKRRLEFMDAQGTDVHIIFPTLGMVGFGAIEDEGLAAACARAYNRYCADFASADPRRLRPAMLIPFNHVDRAIEEMTFAREACSLTVAFANPTPPGATRWSIPEHERLWSALENLDITLAFHESAVGAGPTTVGINRYAGQHSMLYLCAHTVEPQLAVMDMILGGVLTGHPRLRVGLMEAHLSWLPGWLALLDHMGERYPTARIDPVLEPSDVFKRQCFVAAFPDDIYIREALDALPDGNLVFSSDWPHKSLTEQHTTLEEFDARTDLSPAEKDAVLAENPRRWLPL